MFKYILFITATATSVEHVPVFRTTPFLIVLEEMLKDFRVDHAVLVNKVLQNTDLRLTIDQASGAVVRAKRRIVGPVFHPEAFHKALLSYEGLFDLKSEAFLKHFWNYVPLLEGAQYRDESFMKLSVSVWLKYCIEPLRNGEITCRKTERTLPNGEKRVFWILTDPTIVTYIGDFNWTLRLAAFE